MLHSPSRVAGSTCAEHVDEPCPTYRHSVTLNAGRVVRRLALVGLELTDAGWCALGEEVEACGSHPVPVAGGVVQMCSDPEFWTERPV